MSNTATTPVPMDASKADALLSAMPLCMVTLDPTTLKPVSVNALFEREMGPLYKFSGTDFVSAATDDKTSDARARFREAIRTAATSSERTRVRNIEMLTLAGDSGFPVRKFYDWFISSTPETIILLGDPCTDHDVSKREKDAELIDFFQNAPIALHWLSGEGKVLWANQTELNVLGYTAEEYIGQDIMKFCPDEEELVLEIFKQLGSGNTIKDVPVRFRAKDGKIVHLLIDSNVRYEKDGSFGHTRCFIRDDTGRKIRESRASLLLEETKRSLAMLDNFTARSLHHMRTPLRITQNMIDSIAFYFQMHSDQVNSETDACVDMVRMANEQIASSVSFLDDVADLAKFDQGAVMNLNPKLTDLEKLGKSILATMPPTHYGVVATLELCQGDLAQEGPAMAVLDATVLRRVMTHLVNNAVDATHEGSVTIAIGYKQNRLTFSVTDTGPGLERQEGAAEGDLPTIFQRYHQEFIPDEPQDLTIVTSLRDKIEKGINDHKKSSIGIGLSLTYHLVQSLGAELRCDSTLGEGTRFQFSLPTSVSCNTTVPSALKLSSVRVQKAESSPEDFGAAVSMVSGADEFDAISLTVSTTESTSMSTLTGMTEERGAKRTRSDIPTSFEIPKEFFAEVPASCLAAFGVKSQDPPSILVVEDTKSCAKMLCRILSRFNCATKWVENGQEAVDVLNASAPRTYDLVLMDLRMPVMDGFEATRIIKHELGLTVPIVALTGDDNEETRQEAGALDFDDFYGKPLNRDDLVDVIQKFSGYQVP